ncbi:hypothetical protein A7D23_10990 [Dehalobacter sp. TeCB1]|jgi:hypothetical protein|nr:hypothetical protein A7D23_10990 [Dehalobacter sp. TeCB1]
MHYSHKILTNYVREILWYNYRLFAGIMENLIVDHDSDKLNESSPQSLFFVNHLLGSLFD